MKIPGPLENVEPLRLAQHGSRLTGTLTIADLGRIADLVHEDDEGSPGAGSAGLRSNAGDQPQADDSQGVKPCVDNGTEPQAVADSDAAADLRHGSDRNRNSWTREKVVFDLGFSFDENRQAICTGSVKVALRLQCQRCLKGFTHVVESHFVYAFVTSDVRAAHLPGQYEPVVFDGQVANMKDALEDEILLAVPFFPRHEAGECQTLTGSEGSSERREGSASGPFADLDRLLTS